MQKAVSQNFLRWDLSTEALASLADEIISFCSSVQNAVAVVPKGHRTVDNVLEPLAEMEKSISSLISCCDFLHHVHPDESMRKTSVDIDKRLSSFFVDSKFREDLYHVVSDLNESVDSDSLSAEQQRLLKFLIRDFERNGLHLVEEDREKVKAIQKEMLELGIKFSSNLAENTQTISLSEEELEGLPADFIKKRPLDDSGNVILAMKYPDVFPTLKLARNPETRRKVEQMFSSICKEENAAILERLVKLRHEQSQILGYKNHASYVLDVRMAKKPEAVLEFLEDLSVKLRPLLRKEMEIMLELKKKEMDERGIEFDNKIHIWDYRYYSNMREEREFDVDHQLLKDYFPLEKVTSGLFEIYQNLLSLKFVQVNDPFVWHEQVQMYLVFDDHGYVGSFYLDLFPRSGKYSHAACFGIQCQAGDQYPVAAVVANFTKPGPSSPSLLLHNEVVTFFHEFGHVMHQICSKVQYSRFSGTRVERDFVEAPSQMLENWCWEPESLKKMSGHYKTGESLPDHLMDKLIASKNANAGLGNLRQIFFGSFDQKAHSSPSINSAELFNKMQEEIMGISASEGSNSAASFGHLAGGYDASYYGYMWSEVFSADMFESVFKKNLLDKDAGMRYRREILSVGGSRDAMDSIEKFLGRKPNSAAFLKSKGLSLI